MGRFVNPVSANTSFKGILWLYFGGRWVYFWVTLAVYFGGRLFVSPVFLKYMMIWGILFGYIYLFHPVFFHCLFFVWGES